MLAKFANSRKSRISLSKNQTNSMLLGGTSTDDNDRAKCTWFTNVQPLEALKIMQDGRQN